MIIMGTIQSSESQSLVQALRSQRTTTQQEVDESAHGTQYRYTMINHRSAPSAH